jgi:hypothetical protein
VSFGRVGTKAINTFLDLHPELDVPSFSRWLDLQKKLNVNSKQLEIETIFRNDNSLYRGVTLHQQNILSSKVKDKFIFDAYNSIPANKYIHVVRNPFQQILGWMNYINSSAVFKYLNWTKQVFSIKELIKHYPEVFETAKIGRQYKLLLADKENVKTIDFKSLFPDVIDNTMENLYSYLNVEPSYRHPDFKVIQNEIFSRLFHAGLACNFEGHIIHFHFVPFHIYIETFGSKIKPFNYRIPREHFHELCKAIPLLQDDMVFCPKLPVQFNQLPQQTRLNLIQNISNIAYEVGMQWGKESEKILEQIENIKIREYSDEDSEILNKLLGADLNLYREFQPEILKSWGI